MSEDTGVRKVTCEPLRARLLREPLGTLSLAERAHVATCDECAEALVTAGLKQAGEPPVPEGFAARVRAKLPPPTARPKDDAMPERRVTATGVAVAISLVLSLLTCALYAGAPGSWLPAGIMGTVLASLLITEGAGLALWLGLRGTRQ